MNKRVWMVWGLAALMAGCVRTSPLMFVSKTTLGVEISAPGGQGASEPNITLGFKTFDAAYVPVMADLDPATSVLINSTNQVTGATREESATATKQAIETVAQAVKNVGEELKKTIAEGNGENAEERHKQVAELKELAQMLDQLVNTKADALSVFSVIDADGLGRSGDAKLRVGKVFATGIAAQHVADRYRTPYSACSGELIRAVATMPEISDSGQKKEFLNALATLCPERGAKNQPSQ